MTHYMNVTVYDDATADTLRHGDQITVPVHVWQSLDEEHTGTGPIYVRLTCDEASVYGRVRIAVPAEDIDDENCRIPSWMWLHLGAPLPGEGWVTLDVSPELSVVSSITLRPRMEATLLALEDPVTTLSTEISANWSCVMEGSELILPCGTFDIMSLQDASGTNIKVGSVLNTDVNLELLPSLDYKPSRQPTPFPSPVLPAFPGAAMDTVQHLPHPLSHPHPHSHPLPHPRTPTSTPILRGTTGFMPFSGTGYRLGDK